MLSKDFTILIHKLLTNQISSEDNRRLQQWLADKEEHQNYFDEIKQIWELKGKEEPDEIADEEFDQELRKLELAVQDSMHRETRTKKTRRRNLIIAMGGTLLIAFTSLMAFHYNHQRKEQEKTNAAIIQKSEVKISANIMSSFVLDDSIEVILKKGSALGVRSIDSPQTTIMLTGAAVFHSKTTQPIFIGAGGVNVRGMHFMASSDLGKETIIIPLSGSLTVAVNKTIENVSQGMKFTYNEKTSSVRIEQNMDLNSTSWYTNKFVFKNNELDTVFQKLEKHFGVTFYIKEKKALKCHLTATFQDKSLDDILDIIASAEKLEFIKEGLTSYNVMGGGICND